MEGLETRDAIREEVLGEFSYMVDTPQWQLFLTFLLAPSKLK